MKFGKLFGEKGKILKILRGFTKNGHFLLKIEFSRKNRFRIGFSTIRTMMLKFGQDVSLRGTKKLELFLCEKVCRCGATHFFIRENWVFCKNCDFSYKKSV